MDRRVEPGDDSRLVAAGSIRDAKAMTTNHDTENSDTDREILRDRLLDAALTHVPFDGWTAAVLNAAARDIGVAHALALNAFPGGPAEMIEFWNRRSDQRMLAALEARDLSTLRFRDRVALAVRLRLEAAGIREAVRRGLSFLSLPQNAGLGARCLYRTVDAIWHGLGDRSTDFSFYTKRGLLAAVYGATVLYWLDDRSEGSANTWAFLDRRIGDVMKITEARQGLEKGLEKLTERLPDPLGILRGSKPGRTAGRARRRRPGKPPRRGAASTS
jgi:ubiquinone biosynthesis protein COQ9